MAATLGESKISKSFATSAKIQVLCQTIEQPAAPFALRLSSALMLGVVRVFSRKSTIILADTNFVMNALKRYKTQQAGRLSGKKRSRDAANVASGENVDINLQQGEEQARFELITLPIRKKRKSGGHAAQAQPLDALTKPGGSQSRGYQSHGSFWMGGPSFGDSAEIDVVAAMQTVFPTVVIPRLGEHLPSGLNSPRSVHNLGSQRKMLYSARDQDITLSAPMGQLGRIGYDMFEEDLQGSIRSDPMSNAENSRPLWLSEIQDNGQFAQAFGGSVSNDHSKSLGSNKDGNISPFPAPDLQLGIEPLELEPLGIEPIQPAPVLSARNKKKERGLVTYVSTPSSEEASRSVKTPDRNPRTKRVLPVQPTTASGRKRRSSALRVDQVTELSPSEIRGCLNDTRDIVLADFEERQTGSGRKSRRASKEHLSCAIPGFLTSFSKDITDLWRDVTVPPFTAMEGREGIDAPPAPRIRRGPRTQGGAAIMSGAISVPEEIIFEDDFEEIMPVIDPNVVTPREKGASSVEVERANSGLRVPSNDQLSVPSHSLEGKSHSGGDLGDRNSDSGSHRDFLDKVGIICLFVSLTWRIPFHLLLLLFFLACLR